MKWDEMKKDEVGKDELGTQWEPREPSHVQSPSHAKETWKEFGLDGTVLDEIAYIS